METNLRATFAGIAVTLSFCDDEQNHFSDPEIGHKVGLQIDYLGAVFNDIVIALQVNFASMLSSQTPLHSLYPWLHACFVRPIYLYLLAATCF